METTDTTKTPEKDIGAVWVKKAQSVAQFLSLTIDLNQFGVNQKVNLVGFKNKNKKEGKHPDFRVFVSNSAPRPASGDAGASAPAPARPAATPKAAPAPAAASVVAQDVEF